MKLFTVLVLVLSCFAAPVFSADANADATAALNQATQANLAAAELGFVWTTTDQLLKSAQSALDAGDSEKALKLAEKALLLANASIDQASNEAKNWQSRVPK